MPFFLLKFFNLSNVLINNKNKIIITFYFLLPLCHLVSFLGENKNNIFKYITMLNIIV